MSASADMQVRLGPVRAEAGRLEWPAEIAGRHHDVYIDADLPQPLRTDGVVPAMLV